MHLCTKYANICKICKHENYMQHMQKYALPTLPRPRLSRRVGRAPRHRALPSPPPRPRLSRRAACARRHRAPGLGWARRSGHGSRCLPWTPNMTLRLVAGGLSQLGPAWLSSWFKLAGPFEKKGGNIFPPRSSRDNKSIQWKRFREHHLFWPWHLNF